MSWKDAPIVGTASWKDAPIVDEAETRVSSKDVLNMPNLNDMDDETYSKQTLRLFYQNKTGNPVKTEEVDAYVRAEFGEGATPADALKQLREVHATESKGEPNLFKAKQFTLEPTRSGDTVPVANTKEHYQKEFNDYQSELLDFGAHLTDEQAQMVNSLNKMRIDIPKPFDGEPAGAKEFREQKQAEYQKALETAPDAVRISIEKKRVKSRLDELTQLWAGKDKSVIPEKIQNEIADLQEQIHYTDSGFEKRVFSGKAKTAIDLAQFSQYSTHNNQQTAMAVNYGDRAGAKSLIEKMNKMEEAASKTLPEAETIVGKVGYGVLGTAVPMAESIGLAAVSGGTLDKAYWALQGQGEVIKQYVNSEKVDIETMSGAEYAKLKAISGATGALYAAVEFLGGMYGLQGKNFLGPAISKLTNAAMKDPTIAKKIVSGGVRFALEWMSENAEEGLQGFIIKLGEQGISGKVDLIEALSSGVSEFKEAAPATFGMTLIGGGVNSLKNVRRTQKLEAALSTQNVGNAKELAKRLSNAKSTDEFNSILSDAEVKAKESVQKLLGENEILSGEPKEWTVSDVEFIRETMTEQEIDEMVADMEPEAREAAREAIGNPTEEAVNKLNDSIDLTPLQEETPAAEQAPVEPVADPKYANNPRFEQARKMATGETLNPNIAPESGNKGRYRDSEVLDMASALEKNGKPEDAAAIRAGWAFGQEQKIAEIQNRKKSKTAAEQAPVEQTAAPVEQTQDLITEPQTAGELRLLIKGLGGPDKLMEFAVDKEYASQVIKAAGGDTEALAQVNQQVVGAEPVVQETTQTEDTKVPDIADIATVADLTELEMVLNSDKRGEVIETNAEVPAPSESRSVFEEKNSVEIIEPDLVDDVDAWESNQILYVSKLIRAGVLKTESDYNDLILDQDLHEQSDERLIWEESKKAASALIRVQRAAEKASQASRAKITQSQFKPNNEPILVDPAIELREMYRRSIRDINTGRKLGYREGTEAQKQYYKEIQERHKNLRDRAERVMEIYIRDKATLNEFKTKLHKIRGEKSLNNFFEMLHRRIEKQRHSDAKKSLSRIIDRIDKTTTWNPRYRAAIDEMMSGVAIKAVSKKTEQKLISRKEAMERDDVYVPEAPAKEIERLDAVAVSNMTAEEISELTERLSDALDVNNQISSAKRSYRKAKVEARKASLLRNISQRPDKSASGVLNLVLDNALVGTLRKGSFIIEEIDGSPMGEMHQNIIQPMRDSRNRANQSGEKLLISFKNTVDVLPDNWFFSLKDSPITVDGRSITREEAMAVYAHSKNNDTRAILLRNNNFKSQEQIDKIVSELTSEERSVVDSVMELMDSQYENMASVSYNLTGNYPERVQNYFPRAYEWNTAKEYNDATDLISVDGATTKINNPYVESSFTKERTGGSRALRLDFLALSERHLLDVNKYIAYAENVKDVQNILGDKNVKANIERIVGENATKELDRWFLRTVNDRRRHDSEYIPQSVESFAKKARMNNTVATLGVNFISSLVQASSMPLTASRIGARSTADGVSQFITSPKIMTEKVNELSPMMKFRGESFDRDYRDFMQNRSVKAMFENNTNLITAYFKMLRSVDHFTAYSSWLGAYQKGIDMYGEGDSALRYADDVVEKTQPMGDVMNMASIQSGPEILKLFTPFYTAMSHVYNEVDLSTRKGIRGEINFGQWLGEMFWKIIIPSLWGHLIRNPDPDELLNPKSVSRSAAGYVSGMYPVVGSGIGSWITGYNYSATPALDVFKYGQRITKAIGEKDGRKAIENVVAGSGYIIPWPSKQAARTMSGVYDLTADKTDNLLRLIYSEYQLPTEEEKKKREYWDKRNEASRKKKTWFGKRKSGIIL